MELWIAKIQSAREHPIQELVKPLEFSRENNCYIASEYEGTIVVKVSNDKVRQVFLSHYGIVSNEKRIPLIYDAQNDVWYDRGNEVEERSPIGINQCGTFFFEAEDKHGFIIDRSSDVYITSSLLTKPEFEQMKDDIAMMLEDLFTADHGPATTVELWAKNGSMAEHILGKLQKLYEVLLELDRMPHEQLIREYRVVPLNQIKQLDSKVLIERKMFPFKDKFLAPVNIRSIDISEHRMMRWSIERVLDYAHRYAAQAQNRQVELSKRIDFLEYSLKNLYGSNNIEKEKIENSLNKDLQYAYEILQITKQSEVFWKQVIELAEKCLEFHFLQVGEEQLGETHLFTFSPLYSEVYQYLDNLLQASPTKQLANIAVPLQKSPKLYEVWCFISIIHSLIYDCGFITKQKLYARIRQYVKEKGGLEGISFTFERPVYRYTDRYNPRKTNLVLEVHYERPFSHGEKSYRPDFTLIFHDETPETKTAFLDAKYQPLFNRKSWIELIRDTSFRKYYEPLVKKPVASFLMHPNTLNDVSVHTWNAAMKEELRHKLGSFSYKPSDKKGFIKWMNMLVHYHLGYNATCMHCGIHQPARLEIGEIGQKYFTCSNDHCEAFWVQTVCFNRKGGGWAQNDAHTAATATLLKYTKHSGMNYHKETTDEWDVFCPVCNKRAQDRFVH
ncbi:hypothetical protein M493_17195 [Geobacillus genomosp. 3]|uniref:DUF2357 domain-containing protein n=1 Tax=Geobacillus genomosp. 3 TaxID=1921421 RepID=S5Z9X5_GEOG3|nr:nuclease domain-containing protein [Geobacillus genomosp. 3]AGT33647.1 hypothetical protein M493_17195 [Geobacillus genomosp. 3]